jgi:hypothetical protein
MMMRKWEGGFHSPRKLHSAAPPSGGQMGGPRPDPPYLGRTTGGNFAPHPIRLDNSSARPVNPRMKSFFTLMFVLLVLIAVVGGGGLLFYLSYTSEFSRKDKGSAPATAPTTLPAGITPRPKPAPAPAR